MSPIQKLNGIDLHYEDSGEPGAGPALVLTHGYSSTGEAWAPQRAALAGRFRLVTWDMRGHGATESPADESAYTPENTVRDLAALLDHLGIERAVIGGLSLGGYVSLDFYRTFPERVEALVIADSGPGYRNAEARERWNETARARARDFEERGLDVLAGASAERRQAVARHRSARGLALAARGMLAQSGSAVIDSLPAIAVPTMIVVGADDEPYRVPSDYMARKIPGARLEVIEGAGHAANLDQPERFNELLLGFLEEVAGREATR